MKTKIGVFLLAMCMMCVAVPSQYTYAETASENQLSSSEKDTLKGEITSYASLLNSSNKLSQSAKTRLNNLVAQALQSIDDSKSDGVTLVSYVSNIKTQMDNISANQLGSIAEYLVLTDNVQVPVATHGQQVNVMLSILNLSDTPLSDLIITPKVDTSVSAWPFELTTMGYTKVVADIPGSTTYEEALKGRQEITYTFTTRDDVLTGYYQLDFDVKYTRGTSTETTTLSTFVNAIGAAGSGTVEGGEAGNTSKPRIIVTGFETTPADVYAGDVFTIDIHVKNTSQRTAVSNMQVDLQATPEGSTDNQYEAFLPTSGSNTVYINNIAPGGTADISIEMTAKADLAQKPYVLDVNMEYEDEQFKVYTSTASVSVPIKQESKFDLSTPEVMPDSINVGAQSNVMYSIYNTGKTTLYNVQAKFVGDSISGGDVFVGKIEAGGTGNVDAMLTGIAPTMDDGTITAIVTYEDDAGNQSTYEEQFNLYVMEAFIDDFGGMEGGFDPMMPEEESGMPLWIIIVIGVVVVGGVVAGVLILRKVKKQKREDELDLEELDDDL